MFALYLNPMTSNCENATCVAISDDSAKLEQLMVDESCERYTDEGPDMFDYDGGTKNYQKCYKKGGILEMYNSPEGSFCEPKGIVEVPSLADIHKHHEDWLNEDISAWTFRFGSSLQL